MFKLNIFLIFGLFCLANWACYFVPQRLEEEFGIEILERKEYGVLGLYFIAAEMFFDLVINLLFFS